MIVKTMNGELDMSVGWRHKEYMQSFGRETFWKTTMKITGNEN
jgi:hypothetical protein